MFLHLITLSLLLVGGSSVAAYRDPTDSSSSESDEFSDSAAVGLSRGRVQDRFIASSTLPPRYWEPSAATPSSPAEAPTPASTSRAWRRPSSPAPTSTTTEATNDKYRICNSITTPIDWATPTTPTTSEALNSYFRLCNLTTSTTQIDWATPPTTPRTKSTPSTSNYYIIWNWNTTSTQIDWATPTTSATRAAPTNDWYPLSTASPTPSHWVTRLFPTSPAPQRTSPELSPSPTTASTTPSTKSTTQTTPTEPVETIANTTDEKKLWDLLRKIANLTNHWVVSPGPSDAPAKPTPPTAPLPPIIMIAPQLNIGVAPQAFWNPNLQMQQNVPLSYSHYVPQTQAQSPNIPLPHMSSYSPPAPQDSPKFEPAYQPPSHPMTSIDQSHEFDHYVRNVSNKTRMEDKEYANIFRYVALKELLRKVYHDE